MISRPTISVAIVTFNRKQQVHRAIASVLTQAGDQVEIVVVDNASSDGTGEHIAAAFPTVRLIRLPRNVGCPDGRNHAYANCTGPIIVNLDDDGWLSDDFFRPLLEVFAADPRIGIVAFRQSYPEAEAGVSGRAMSTRFEDVAHFAGGVSAFRRTMLDEIGGFPADFFLFAEETFLSLRALDAGFRIVSAPHLVMWHPRVGGSHGNAAKDYHLYRNSLLVVARLYPLHLLLLHLPLKLGNLARISFARSSFRSFARATVEVLLALPRTLRTRTPVSVATVQRYLAKRRQWAIASADGQLRVVSGAVGP